MNQVENKDANNMNPMNPMNNSSKSFFCNLPTGFISAELRTTFITSPDIRRAKPFASWEEADAAGKEACARATQNGVYGITYWCVVQAV